MIEGLATQATTSPNHALHPESRTAAANLQLVIPAMLLPDATFAQGKA